MLRPILVASIVLLLIGCATSPEPQATGPTVPAIDHLRWLAGSWRHGDDTNLSEEVWLTPAGRSMLGVNRSISGGRMVFFEYFRIEYDDDGTIVFLASPVGRHPPTPFRMIEMRDQYIAFENPMHDFPQRIIYYRDGDTLHGRIEGTESGVEKATDWMWTRVR